MRTTTTRPSVLLLLRSVLAARCVLDLGFAWHIQRLVDPSTIHLADAFAPFALLDGIAGLTVAIVGYAALLPPSIVVLAAVDAMLRLAAASALHFGPGIPYFPMTMVLYVGLLAAFGLAFGIAEAVAARQIEHDEGWNRLSIALGIAGLATVALAITQFALLHAPNVLERSLIVGIILQAVTMLAIAAGIGQKPVEGSRMIAPGRSPRAQRT